MLYSVGRHFVYVGANISTAKLLRHSCPCPYVCAYWRRALLETQQSRVSVQQDVVGLCRPGTLPVKCRVLLNLHTCCN